MSKDEYAFCKTCENYQKLGSISKHHMMPLNLILVIEIFECWGIYFMEPFPPSFGFLYILLIIDYFSKWIKAIPSRNKDHKIVIKFLKQNILSQFGIPRAMISDGGTHFWNKPFESLIKKYGITHKVPIPYHHQINGQVKLANRKIKQILFHFFFPKKFRSDDLTSHLFKSKRTLPTVRLSLNFLVMQYFFNTKNQIHFDPIIVLNHFMLLGVVEPFTTGGANAQGRCLDKRIHSRIAIIVESLTSEKKCLAEARKRLTHFICQANDLYFVRTIVNPNRKDWSLRLNDVFWAY